MGLLYTLFGFEGRLRRRDWWLGRLGLLLAEYLLWLAAARVEGVTTADLVVEHRTSLLGVGVYLAFLWPTLALDIKRLHDRNRTGWWLVLFHAPLRIWTFTAAAEPGRLQQLGWAAPLTVYLFAALLVLLFELGVRDAAPGAERFGPPPKPERPEAPRPGPPRMSPHCARRPSR